MNAVYLTEVIYTLPLFLVYCERIQSDRKNECQHSNLGQSSPFLGMLHEKYRTSTEFQKSVFISS